MDIIKLLQNSDPLISAAKLNEILPGKIQTIFIMVAQIVCSCHLKARELTVAEGEKFQKEVRNALNWKFTK